MPTPTPIDVSTWYKNLVSPRFRGTDPFNAGGGSSPCFVSLVEGMHESTQPTFAKPEVGVQFNDPTYGTCITRLTDHIVEGTVIVRNDYSRRDPLNADNTTFFGYIGAGWWRIFDYATLTANPNVPDFIADGEPQWHPTDPDVIYWIPNSGGLVINTYTVSTDISAQVTDFTNVTAIVGIAGTSIFDVFPTAQGIWTRSEGSPSADGRYWAFMVEDASFTTLGLITYDMQTDSIVGTYDFATYGITVRPNNVSMSPTGSYVVCAWYASLPCEPYDSGTLASPCGIMAFNQTLTDGHSVSRFAEHMDIGLDALGNDVVVLSNYSTGFVECVDLATANVTNLFGLYIDGGSISCHVSCKNHNKPGWAAISTYNASVPGGAWFDNKIMLVELKANPRILNLAHTQNVTTTYWNEVHGCLNRDATKLIYNCNWNSGLTDVDMYEITLPTGIF